MCSRKGKVLQSGWPVEVQRTLKGSCCVTELTLERVLNARLNTWYK
jgi:hypothetical protein